jgi:hypothetical protein
VFFEEIRSINILLFPGFIDEVPLNRMLRP